MRRSIVLILTAALVAGCSGATPTMGPASPTTGPTAQPTGPAEPTAQPTTPGDDGIELAKADVARLSTTSDDASAAGTAVNAFGLDLYKRIVAADPDANAVFSPASIALALAMARAGAKGDTAAEMDAVMHNLGTDANAAWVAALDASLNTKTATFKDAMGEPAKVTLRSVNAPFAQRDYPLETVYLEALAERFEAGLRQVDFVGDPEASRGAINAWVNDQTEARIPELLAEGTIDEATRLVLVNAIYLKAPWNEPFFEEATRDEPFTRLDGSQATVPMMHGGGYHPYAEGDGWQAVQLGYAGDGLAMLVIVPEDLVAFEATLDGAALDRIAASMDTVDVSVGLPRFSVETALDLGDTLAALGMPAAFDPGAADFSGMTTADRLYIGKVVHQANIDVDEKGTEAAAATAVAMAAGAAPGEPKVLLADQPFLYALRDVDSGAIVFLGRVTQP